ncbi:MAG: AMP-binding protein [Fusobacteriaceae bacterium]
MEYFLYNRNKTSLIYDDIEYSYKDLISSAKHLGNLLNIEKDDRVVIFSENRPEFIFAFFGIWDKSGISVNIDGGYTPEQVAYVLKDSNPKYIFTSSLNLEAALKAKELADSSVHIINLDEVVFNKESTSEIKGIEFPEDDKVVVILYTSGTTGEPKGVMLTFKNIMSNMTALQELKLIQPEDKILAILPMHHILTLVSNILAPLYLGSLVVILKELSSDAIKTAMQKYEITVVMGVPRLWEMFHKGIMSKINSSKVAHTLFKICEKLKNPAISKKVFKKIHTAFGGHMKLLASGGAKLDPQIMRDFTNMGFLMLEGYGLTETSPLISFNHPDDIKAGTVGFPIPGVEVKIADDGEILVKGANVMKGYYNKPEATAQAIVDGWFNTGDLGFFDGKHLTITGRKKEMIVLSNGKNINPSDIEVELIKGSNLIKEIAVVEYKNHLLALIYPDFDLAKTNGIANIKEELKWQIIDKYNITAPKYRKILETKIISTELPKTRLGKLQRFKLNALIVEDIETEVVKEKKVVVSDYIETEEFQKLSAYIKTLHEDTEITPESHIEIDLGMDSLDNVELISYIETTFGVEVSEEELAHHKIMKELADLIKEKGGTFKVGDVNWKKIFDSPVNYPMPKSIKFGKFMGLVFLKPFFSLYIKLNKKGMEKIPNSPVIFVGNHQSMIDAFAFAQLLNGEALKKTYYLGVSIHFNSKLKKLMADHSNIITIDMNRNIKESLKISANVLKNGNNIVIFPEGARTRDGELQEFKKSFAILSKELNIPVVPFVVKGAYDLMPFGKSFPSNGKMEVEILDAISPTNYSIEELVKEVKEQIENRLK